MDGDILIPIGDGVIHVVCREVIGPAGVVIGPAVHVVDVIGNGVIERVVGLVDDGGILHLRGHVVVGDAQVPDDGTGAGANRVLIEGFQRDHF